MFRPASALLAAALAAGFATAPVFAEGSDTVVSGTRYDPELTRAVIYTDLNLASEKGVATLNRRVRNAADAICIQNGRTDLRTRQLGWECYKAAIASAAPQVTAAIQNFGNQSLAARGSLTVIGRP
jgi:UrcA family protein